MFDIIFIKMILMELYNILVNKIKLLKFKIKNKRLNKKNNNKSNTFSLKKILNNKYKKIRKKYQKK